MEKIKVPISGPTWGIKKGIDMGISGITNTIFWVSLQYGLQLEMKRLCGYMGRNSPLPI
jgi:hypothetical protein